MAESTLATTYADLRLAIAHYLGYGLTASAWTTDEETEIAMALKDGLTQFYFPPKTEDRLPHKWSFLTPVTTLDTIAPYSTGTVAITKTGTTVTLTTGVWPSWAATHGSLVVDSVEYVIATRTDDEFIELADAWTEDTVTVATFILKHNGNYDLPDDYAGMVGPMIVESSNFEPDITRISEGQIRSMRQQDPQNSGTSASPLYAAIRPKTQSTTTVGQRFEVMFSPLPNSVITISYAMRLLPEMLVATTLTHPYGGAAHSLTLKASCLAAAENLMFEKRGEKWAAFMTALETSIGTDNSMNSREFFGYNGDNSDARHRATPDTAHESHRYRRPGLVTYEP